MTDQIRKQGSAVTRDVQITFDCADPARLAAFWAEALGYQVQAPPGDFESWDQALEAMGVPPENRNDASAVVDPEGTRPRLFFQRVPEGKTGEPRTGRPDAS
ncbi:VOC family protein [Micromonospora inaquosa]|uniref:VOC family protein n=1 Tax=Micromonospora inaquosa TaxID=2203716 RepID=UPI001ABF9B54|nr:VOC family protein [Micromonospora inaquosa]